MVQPAASGTPEGHLFQAVPLAFFQFVLDKTLECYFKDNDDVEKYEQYDQIYI